eukprot:scaffold673298_cov64-Prasinocladus_malaysianus.AAC.1
MAYICIHISFNKSPRANYKVIVTRALPPFCLAKLNECQSCQSVITGRVTTGALLASSGGDGGRGGRRGAQRVFGPI